MATPIGHTLIGLAAGIGYFVPTSGSPATVSRAIWHHRWQLIGIAALACAPDVDFLLGLPFGDFNRFHQSYTHTAGWIFLLLTGIWLAWQSAHPGDKLKRFIFLAAVGLSHLGIDLMTVDLGEPWGIPALWPVYEERIYTPMLAIFRDVDRNHLNIFSWHNIRSLSLELAYTLPFPLLLFAWKCRHKAKNLMA